jgi:hypothetical protein
MNVVAVTHRGLALDVAARAHRNARQPDIRQRCMRGGRSARAWRAPGLGLPVPDVAAIGDTTSMLCAASAGSAASARRRADVFAMAGFGLGSHHRFVLYVAASLGAAPVRW